MEGRAAVSARDDLINALTEHACCFSEGDATRMVDAFAQELSETTPAALHCGQQRQPHGVHLWETAEGAAGAVTGLWYCPGGTT